MRILRGNCADFPATPLLIALKAGCEPVQLTTATSRRRVTRRIPLVTLFMLMLTSLSYSQKAVVWQIGQYDRSSLEFSSKARAQVIYRVGESDWKKDWPGEQLAGSTYKIEFSLDAQPQGTFVLDVSTLIYAPGVPALTITINGHKGEYYLHPRISYYLGDQRSVFDPGYSSYVLSVDLPPSYLHRGENILDLSAVPQQYTYFQQDNAPSVHYDSITLSDNRHTHYTSHAVHATVIPSVFYKIKDGRLCELVDAFLHFSSATPAEDVALTLGGHRYMQHISAMKDAGEQRVVFEIPEWTGTMPGRLTIGKRHGSQFPLSLTASRKWTLFVVPHTHVDVGYTDYQGKVAEVQARTLDEAMKLIKLHPDFRFATDGSWNVEQFLATRSKARQDQLFRFVQDGKIGIPAQYANLLTGYASLETLYRSLYYSKWLSRKYKIPFDYANTTDIPTYTGAYPSILASAGIKYWVAAGNNDRAPILSHEAWNEESPFWWEGPDGKKVLFWYSRCYSQIMFLFGLPPHQAAVYETLPIFLQAYSKPTYKPDVALIDGAQAENTDLYPEIAQFATTWNEHFAYPKLQYATFADFFKYLDEHYGNELPTYKGDMGPYWEDGVGSDAFYTAEDRDNQSGALAAEILSTVSHNVKPDLHPPAIELHDLWKNLELFAEHTWTAGVSIRQPDSEETIKQLAVKDNYARQSRFEVEDIRNRSLDQLADDIHIPANTLVVFNALSWKRDAMVETDLGDDEGLIDMTTKQPVSVGVVSSKEHFRRVRFLAEDIPSVGYKCYQIVPKTESASSEPAASNDSVVENQYYRITVDAKSGAVKSLFDKQLHRELVDTRSKYKFGQYLYVTGGDGNTKMINPFQPLPSGELTIHAAGDGQYLGTRKTPWGDSIELRSSDVNTPDIQLEILLFDNEKKIEFRYRVQKNYTTSKEGVYFAFPVAATSPHFDYATQEGWVDPAKDMFKGANVEWFNIQKWMAVQDSGVTVGIVPVDAPLATFGDINRGKWPGEFHPKSSTIFSYIMNNYWHTNFRAGQGGKFTFQYVMTSAGHFDPAALSRLGWESMEPVEVDHVVKQEKIGDPAQPLPADGTSFLNISSPNVVLVTWKLAENGVGTILRLKEIAGETAQAVIQVPGQQIHSASICNAMEDNSKHLEVSGNQIHLAFHPHEVLTIRVVR